jgi:hypothetical protein
MLLAAVTTVLDRSDRVALLERTRAEIQGLTITAMPRAGTGAVSTGARTRRQSEWRPTSTHERLLLKGSRCRNMDAVQYENSPSVAKVAKR